MDYITCQQLLTTTIDVSPRLVTNLSNLTSRAWGDQKSSCLDHFKTLSSLDSYIVAYQK